MKLVLDEMDLKSLHENFDDETINNLDWDNANKIATYLDDNKVEDINYLFSIYMDLFLWDYVEFVEKFALLKCKLGDNYADLISEDVSALDDMYTIDIDPDEAKRWLLKAAEQGYYLAQYEVGIEYKYKYSDPDEGERWLLKAAEQGYDVAQCEVGIEYKYKYSDPDEGERWLLKAAEQGYDVAQCEVGLTYNSRDNYAEALTWFLKAADQGYDYAQYLAAVNYEKGLGTTKDYEKAAHYYLLSAEQGFKSSMFELAGLYELGLGVEQSKEMSEHWLKKYHEKK